LFKETRSSSLLTGHKPTFYQNFNDINQIELNQSDTSLNQLLNSKENYFDPIDVKTIHLHKFKKVSNEFVGENIDNDNDRDNKIINNNPIIKERTVISEKSNSIHSIFNSEKLINIADINLTGTTSQQHFKNSQKQSTQVLSTLLEDSYFISEDSYFISESGCENII